MCEKTMCFVMNCLDNVNVYSFCKALETFDEHPCKKHTIQWQNMKKLFFETYHTINFDTASLLDCSPHNMMRIKFSQAKDAKDILDIFDLHAKEGDVDLEMHIFSTTLAPIEQKISIVIKNLAMYRF